MQIIPTPAGSAGSRVVRLMAAFSCVGGVWGGWGMRICTLGILGRCPGRAAVHPLRREVVLSGDGRVLRGFLALSLAFFSLHCCFFRFLLYLL